LSPQSAPPVAPGESDLVQGHAAGSPSLIRAPLAGLSLQSISKNFGATNFAEPPHSRPSGQRTDYESLLAAALR